MKIYVDFENSLLNNNLDICEKFKELHDKYSEDNNKELMLPYNSSTIAILKDNFYNDSIILIVKSVNEKYIPKVMDDLVNLFEIRTSGVVIDDNYVVEDDNVYIGPYNKEIALNDTIEKIYVDYFPRAFFNNIRSNNSKMISMGLGGILYTPIVHSFIIVPLLCNWMIWWNSLAFLKLYRLNSVFLASAMFLSFFKIFRILLEVNNERHEFFNNGNEIIHGEDLIYGHTNIYVMIFYGLLAGFVGLCTFFFDPFGMIIGLLIGGLYGIFLFSSFKMRWAIMTPVMGILGFLSQL